MKKLFKGLIAASLAFSTLSLSNLVNPVVYAADTQDGTAPMNVPPKDNGDTNILKPIGPIDSIKRGNVLTKLWMIGSPVAATCELVYIIVDKFGVLQ